MGALSETSLSILVVDDNESFCIGLKDVLELYGHVVNYITGGEGLASALEGTVYDAVIMDLRLPGFSGIELASFVKARDPGVACIISTGHGKKLDVVEALNLGFEGFIEKPYKVDDLIVVLERGVRLAKTRYVQVLENEIQESEERVRAERVQRENEEELSRLKTRFMSTATHDLRTPLASIQGYTELIQRDEGNLSDNQRQYLTVIQRNVQRLTKLTDDLLEQQRLEEGTITVTLEPVKVRDLIELVRSELLPILGVKRQRFEVSCVDVVVGMDRFRVMQVLVNLMSNASKFSPEGSMIIVDVIETGEGVQFSVSDMGVGIGEEDIGKLFTPFPGILVEGNVGGTGLGLSISRGIVELHGGEIWAESEGPGKGSTFRFTIPLN